MSRYPLSSSTFGRPVARSLSVVLIAVLLGLLLVATPAAAAGAVSRAEKLAVLADWTATSSASYGAWNAARLDRDVWSAYAFDWSTDSCSASPERPLGFDFTLGCQRHDFGYRNYKAAGLFNANKPRLDNAFHADLKRRCASYNFFVRPACLSLAWTYYQAVKTFGTLTAVNQSDVDRAQRLKSDGERAAAAHR